jgi:dephospho-CoA kinase
MLKIGITGGMGSGKSTVCKVFEQLGIPVYYADARAKQLMHQNLDLIAGIKAQFGENAYLPDGSLNRAYIAEKAFQDSQATAQLNALVHPAVYKDFESWAQSWEGKTPYVLKEAALMFESDSYKQLDFIILVIAHHDLINNGLMLKSKRRPILFFTMKKGSRLSNKF